MKVGWPLWKNHVFEVTSRSVFLRGGLKLLLWKAATCSESQRYHPYLKISSLKQEFLTHIKSDGQLEDELSDFL